MLCYVANATGNSRLAPDQPRQLKTKQQHGVARTLAQTTSYLQTAGLHRRAVMIPIHDKKIR